jgi:hypothetical protein
MEGRSQKRIPKWLSVRFGLNGLDKVGFTDDLTLGSLFIKTSIVLPPGRSLWIQVTLPNEKTVEMIGEVVGQRRFLPTWSIVSRSVA